ncbi:MAG: PA0069 family radical SAM protein [Pseudomonadota bacterium]
MPTGIEKGRGAVANPTPRFERYARELEPGGDPEPQTRTPTTVAADRSRSILSTNTSPDVGFDRSINPYRGCEHGCIYCYARPGHAYLGLSPGRDFETTLFAKHDAPALLEAALARPGYRPAPLQLSGVTDAWQPIERRLEITRRLLEVLLAWRHPVRIVTKSASILRDVDLLQDLAAHGLVTVDVSITTLEADLARRLEPRASTPARRLGALKALADAGVPVGVSVAPIIPGLTDHEIERLLAAAADAGATSAGYVLLRLPHELRELFDGWLEVHAPLRREKVLSLVRQTRGGALNDARFSSRMTGTGPLAELIRQRFQKAHRRYGLDKRSLDGLRTDLFRPPGTSAQGELFGDGAAE